MSEEKVIRFPKKYRKPPETKEHICFVAEDADFDPSDLHVIITLRGKNPKTRVSWDDGMTEGQVIEALERGLSVMLTD